MNKRKEIRPSKKRGKMTEKLDHFIQLIERNREINQKQNKNKIILLKRQARTNRWTYLYTN